MAELTETDKTQVCTDAAETFVDAYYTALNGARKTIASFYVPTSTTGRALPYISYNGSVDEDASVFQTKFDQMPYTHFEVQGMDCHVLNPRMDVEWTAKTKKETELNMSLILQVSGYVRLFERLDGPMHTFSDTIVLVGNKDFGKQKGGRKWLIQTQNFRFLT